MTTPTEVLKEEHAGVKRSLRILGRMSDRLESGRDVDPRDMEEILEFLKVFVDRCHHAKEEEHLFPALERIGIPGDHGPIGVMLAEHRDGREHIRTMSEAAAAYGRGERNDSPRRFAESARGYIRLLLAHIDKEDYILYPMADAHLPEAGQRKLLEAFERVEEERVGHGRHEEFHRLLDRLEDVYVTGSADAAL